MKILYVAYKYDYGDFRGDYSAVHYNLYDALIKMNNSSNKVVYFSIDETKRKLGREEMNRELWRNFLKEKPDLVFFKNEGHDIKRETIKKISREGRIVTINWCCDDQWKFYKYSQHWAPLYRWVATTDHQAIKKYQRIGCKNVILLQGACNHFLFKPLNLPKIYDVSFIGHPHGNRKKIINFLKKAGIDVKCWGNGWPQGKVSQEEMLKIFSQSKINLNFTKASGIFWKELASIFLHRKYDRSIEINNPKYLIDSIKTMQASLYKKQIKGRNFEVPGCGGFLLSEYVGHLEDYYEIDKEIVCFKNIKELIKKIKYYLAHEEEREAIAKAGYERTIKDHTWEKRFNEIFKIIGLPY